MSAALGHFAVSRGAVSPPGGGRSTSGTASGGLEVDESVCVNKRNPYPEFAVDGIGGSPSNGSFSISLRTIIREGYAKRALFQKCVSVSRV